MGKSTLDVEIEQVGHVSVIRLSGPVDSANYETFRKALKECCGRPGSKAILDCEELSYMNSKSFGLLSQYTRSLLASMGGMVLCSLNRKLVKTMDLLGLTDMVKITEDRESALAELQ